MTPLESRPGGQLSRDKILRETSPLSIFLVVSGSGGNRLLFRYPFDKLLNADGQAHDDSTPPSTPGRGAGANSWSSSQVEQDRLQVRSIIRENDDALCNMFAVNPSLCGQKFEIKINSTRHVGHPVSLLDTAHLETGPEVGGQVEPPEESSGICLEGAKQERLVQDHAPVASYEDSRGQENSQSGISITSFNIVCSLRASASFDIVDCYHSLSKRLAIALKFEEKRCQYLSREIRTILATLEENDMAAMEYQQEREQQQRQVMAGSGGGAGPVEGAEPGGAASTGAGTGSGIPGHSKASLPSTRHPQVSVYQLILERSRLAKDLKRVFESLTTLGTVHLKINNWVNVSFCLPQKVHRLKLLTHKSMPAVNTRDIERCLLSLRPYHGLLLLYEPEELLESLPIDASPACIQLIRVTTPNKNLMDLSVDANITLKQLYTIASQLIYWSKAAVIYPICDSNIYAIHPLASTGLSLQVARDFQARFPSSKSLHHYLADFSEGTSLSQLNKPLLDVEEKLNLLSIVTWLLQRRILTQVHKYIFLVVQRDAIPSSASAAVNGDDSDTEQPFDVDSPTTTVPSRSPKDTKLLNRLIPYFNGKHHIEDIMFFENLERSQILILCDKFRDILFTCHYEDMAVSQLSPYESAR